MEKLSLVVWFHQRLVRDDRVRQGCSFKLLNLEHWLWKSYHQIQLFSAFLYAGIESSQGLPPSVSLVGILLLFHENIFCWSLGRCRVILVLLNLNACWLLMLIGCNSVGYTLSALTEWTASGPWGGDVTENDKKKGVVLELLDPPLISYSAWLSELIIWQL